MFKKQDDKYLISIIPKFKLTLETLPNLSYFDEILDLRQNEDFLIDHLTRPEAITKHLPVLSKSEMNVIETLAKSDETQCQTTKEIYVRKHLDNFMKTKFGQQAHMKKPPSTLIHTYKPLIMCHDGKELSELVGLHFLKAGFYPYILENGYAAYRSIVEQYFEVSILKLHGTTVIVTGPSSQGKKQFIKILEIFDEQVLNLEYISQSFSFSQIYFETILFNQLLQLNHSKTIWVIFDPEKCKNVKVPAQLETIMSKSVRIHTEDELEARIRFILQDFPWISMDKCNTNEISDDIDQFCHHEDDSRDAILLNSVSRCFKRMNQTLGANFFVLPSPSQEQIWDLYKAY